MSDGKVLQSRNAAAAKFCRQKNFVCDRRPVIECQQNTIVWRMCPFCCYFIARASLADAFAANTSDERGIDWRVCTDV